MKVEEVLAAVEAMYPEGHVGFRELPDRSGFIGSRIDLLVIGTWPSHGPVIEAIEVKVSRSDLRRELRTPKKRSGWDGRCTAFYLAAPTGLCRPAEVPPDCRLIEVEDGVARVSIEAPRRPFAPTLSLLQTVAKRVGQSEEAGDGR